jgi:formylglycine-generating enzyme required for sulfatase activity
VGSFPKDKSFYGSYDMAGNASEWCADWFKTDYYKLKEAKRNPEGPTEDEAEEVVIYSGKGTKGKERLLRGGSWLALAFRCRALNRHHYTPSSRLSKYGFRVVVVPRPAGASVPVKGATTNVAQPPPAVGAFDNAYVTTAATGEKIPHPLSRKTAKQTLADGTTVDVPEGMVYVPASEFTMGEGESEHRVYLDAYFIGKYEVTNAEWKVFTELASFEPLPSHWKDGKIPAGKENHPVVNVSWEDAQKYCEWATRLRQGFGGQDSRSKWEVRLPTEAQWEKAARGPDDYIYPWGNQWDKDLCNSGYNLAQFGFRPNAEGEDWDKKWAEWKKTEKGKEILATGGTTTPVGFFPKGKSFYDCYDMAGNAYEWCADWFMTNYFKLKDAKRNPEGPSEEEAEEKNSSGKKMKARLLRGGSWNDYSGYCRSVPRGCDCPSNRGGDYGFRVVVSFVR